MYRYTIIPNPLRKTSAIMKIHPTATAVIINLPKTFTRMIVAVSENKVVMSDGGSPDAAANPPMTNS